MLSFNGFNKITTVISRPTPNCVVKLNVETQKKLTYTDHIKYEKKETFVPAISTYNFNKVNGLYIDIEGQIILEKITKEEFKNKCIITQRDTFSVMNMLNRVYEWLKNPQNIYEKDKYGVISKIKDSNLREQIPMTSSYLAFKPCIIRDPNNTTYEGVGMGNIRGEITNFTGMEFASFRMMMLNLLPNLPLLTQMALTNSMLYCVNTNMEEMRNGR